MNRVALARRAAAAVLLSTSNVAGSCCSCPISCCRAAASTLATSSSASHSPPSIVTSSHGHPATSVAAARRSYTTTTTTTTTTSTPSEERGWTSAAANDVGDADDPTVNKSAGSSPPASSDQEVKLDDDGQVDMTAAASNDGVEPVVVPGAATASSGTAEEDSAATVRRQALGAHRQAVGLYRTDFLGDPELHLNEMLPSASSPTTALANNKVRGDLTSLFRRFRDSDQSDAMIVTTKRALDAIDLHVHVGHDVDFACLILNVHHTLRIAPSDALLDFVANTVAPRIRTPIQLEVVISAFYDMAGPQRTHDLLASLVVHLDALAATMRKETVVLVFTRLVDANVTPAPLIQALIERTTMLVTAFTFHELAQLCLAVAGAANRPEDIKEVFETEFAPQLLKKVDFSVAQDLASALYAFAEVGVPVPDLVAQCASRLYGLHHELDADGVAMAITALALMDIRAPKLTKALVRLLQELDLARVTALAALDMAHAMLYLGIRDDVAMSMLTARILADRSAILASPSARQRLVHLSELLSANASSDPAAADAQRNSSS